MFTVGILLLIVLFRFLAKQTTLRIIARHLIQAIIGIQILVGLLKFNLVATFFIFMREVVNRLITYSTEGTKFVFGALGAEQGERSVGLIIAFQVLPTIIFVASIFCHFILPGHHA